MPDTRTIPTAGEKIKNAPLIVMIEEAFLKDPELKDILAFHETNQVIVFNRDFKHIKQGRELEDSHEDELIMYLSKTLRRDIPRQKFEIACNVISSKKIINPIKDYLNGLVWDRVPRLGCWLNRYANAPLNDYTAEVGKIVLTAAVARIFEPGIKYDYMMILEGKTRIGKSRMLQALAGPDWYLDMHLEDTNKDIIDNMRGKWIIEISELAGFSKKENDWLKAFLSRGTDRVRLSYGRRSKDYPRQSILIGSMNPSGDNTYFKDDTGNARYWPVVCGSSVDVDGIAHNRNLLFAEAMDCYRRHQSLYLTGKTFELAEIEQEIRLNQDPWTSEVRSVLIHMDRPTTSEILNKLSLPINQRGHYEQIRLGKIMRYLGYSKKQGTNGERYYEKET